LWKLGRSTDCPEWRNIAGQRGKFDRKCGSEHNAGFDNAGDGARHGNASGEHSDAASGNDSAEHLAERNSEYNPERNSEYNPEHDAEQYHYTEQHDYTKQHDARYDDAGKHPRHNDSKWNAAKCRTVRTVGRDE
jgi:hypothetical protein